MEGGISAWHGMVAEGTPDSGRAYFASAKNTEELIALAWIMEDGSRRFYSGVADILDDGEAPRLFRDLTTAEDHHKESLLNVFTEMSGRQADTNFPASVFPDAADKDIMEGGMKVAKALEWVKGKNVVDALELSIAMEINAYDLYIAMEREVQDENSKKAFKVLADEEKQHLERLSSLLEKGIK
jgi:rubrerythrin